MNIDLPFHKSWFDDDEINEVVDTLKSGWLTMGPKTRQFEEDFALAVDSSHALSVNSCTAGLHLALTLQGFEPGDEIITTPLTFPATVNPLLHLGLKPVFVDVEPDTLNLDVTQIEEKITSRTRAILPVHFGGHPCDMDAIDALAEKHKLVVIEDAAHAFGASYKARKVGGLGHLTSFSFYANKNITTGEGGMVTVDDEETAERIRTLRLQGISKDAWKRYGKSGFSHWEHQAAGYKFNMSDINAALGIHQLKKAERFQTLRHRYANKYDEAFEGRDDVEVLKVKPDVVSARHIYVLAPDPEVVSITRDEFLDAMQNKGIGMAVHYRALHLQPYFRQYFDYTLDDLPVASAYSDRVVSIPLYPRMTESEVQRVIDTATSILQTHRR